MQSTWWGPAGRAAQMRRAAGRAGAGRSSGSTREFARRCLLLPPLLAVRVLGGPAAQQTGERTRPDTGASCRLPCYLQVRAPMPPTYVFVIDVSNAAAASGMLRAACGAIKASLDSLPGDERTQVAFITFDK